jgi:hypothetical protein
MGNQKERDSQLGGIWKEQFGSVAPFMQGMLDMINKIQQDAR